jgi:hypothetical protein
MIVVYHSKTNIMLMKTKPEDVLAEIERLQAFELSEG